MIHIIDGQTDKILDFIPHGDFWDDVHRKSLKDTLETYDFKTFGDKDYSEHLAKMNRIVIPDEDGTNIELVINHTVKYKSVQTLVTEVFSSASYLLLKKSKVIRPQKLVSVTGEQGLDFALAGTEWKRGIVESDAIRTIEIENYMNPYSFIKRLATELGLEPRFRIEDDGNKVTGRYVDLLERVGEWRGREIEFGKDLLGIERKEDTSNIVTALIGLGPEREDGTRLEVFVEDADALQRWGRPNPDTGELMHLVEVYEPQSTDQNMTEDRLRELTQNELEKRVNSVVEYTTDIADLEKVPGMENKKIRFGDTIRIKDTGFNPPLYLEARVHTQDRSLSQPEKKKVTLGDYIEYTEEEVHAIWRQLQAQIKEKISAQELYDYTYAKPVIDSKDEAVRSDVESYANTVSENAKDAAITYTNNTVNPIIVRVDDIEEDIANHENRISQAQTDIIQAFNEINLRATKTELDIVSDQVNNVIGEINVLAGQIELKVDVDGVISAINLSQEVVKISADRIEFEGHVFGEDATFTGKIQGSEIQGANIIGATITGAEINGSIINSVDGTDSIRIGEGKLTAEYDLGNTRTIELSGWRIRFFSSLTDEWGYIGIGDSPYNPFLELFHRSKLLLTAPVVEIFGDILEFSEDTGVQQIRFNTSGDGRIYFGRYGSDDGWALIGNQSRIAIFDYEYGGAFPIVIRRSPKAVEINGSFSVSGTKSAVVDTENYGRRLMYAVEAPDNRFMDVIEGVFETGEYWILLNRMFAETINGYSVFPIPQGKGIAKILKKETDRFKVYVESEEPTEIAFWVYGKRKGYEEIYMEEVTDFEEGIA